MNFHWTDRVFIHLGWLFSFILLLSIAWPETEYSTIEGVVIQKEVVTTNGNFYFFIVRSDEEHEIPFKSNSDYRTLNKLIHTGDRVKVTYEVGEIYVGFDDIEKLDCSIIEPFSKEETHAADSESSSDALVR